MRPVWLWFFVQNNSLKGKKNVYIYKYEIIFGGNSSFAPLENPLLRPGAGSWEMGEGEQVTKAEAGGMTVGEEEQLPFECKISKIIGWEEAEAAAAAAAMGLPRLLSPPRNCA